MWRKSQLSWISFNLHHIATELMCSHCLTRKPRNSIPSELMEKTSDTPQTVLETKKLNGSRTGLNTFVKVILNFYFNFWVGVQCIKKTLLCPHMWSWIPFSSFGTLFRDTTKAPEIVALSCKYPCVKVTGEEGTYHIENSTSCYV